MDTIFSHPEQVSLTDIRCNGSQLDGVPKATILDAAQRLYPTIEARGAPQKKELFNSTGKSFLLNLER